MSTTSAPDSGAPGSGRSRAVATVATVVAVVAAVILGVAATRLIGDDEPAVAGPGAGEPTVLGDSLISVDAGTLTDEQALAACATEEFAGDGEVEVLYAVSQRLGSSETPSVLLRNAAGELRMCDVAGPDSPSQQPVPTASDAEPVVFLGSRADWTCDKRVLERYQATTWLAVDDAVATVQQRFVVDGQAEPWFSTQAVGGYAHLQSELVGPLGKATELEVEHRVLDAAGDPVTQEALSSQPAALAGCTGGDVSIG